MHKIKETTRYRARVIRLAQQSSQLDIELNYRELEILDLVAQEYSPKEIAVLSI